MLVWIIMDVDGYCQLLYGQMLNCRHTRTPYISPSVTYRVVTRTPTLSASRRMKLVTRSLFTAGIINDSPGFISNKVGAKFHLANCSFLIGEYVARCIRLEPELVHVHCRDVDAGIRQHAFFDVFVDEHVL